MTRQDTVATRWSGFTKLRASYQRHPAGTASLSQQSESRDPLAEADRIPAQDGVCLTAMQTPMQLVRQQHPRRTRHRRGRPAEFCHGPTEFSQDVWAEMKCQPDIGAIALNLVNDLNAPGLAVQPNCTSVPGRGAQDRVTVVLRDPTGHGAVVGDG